MPKRTGTSCCRSTRTCPTRQRFGAFHHFRVLGRTAVTDPADRQRLDDALRAAVEPFYTSRPVCFSPRLGIRVTDDGRTTDFLICFGCKKAVALQGGRVVADWITGRAPKAAFDRVLQGAGVPLPAAED